MMRPTRFAWVHALLALGLTAASATAAAPPAPTSPPPNVQYDPPNAAKREATAPKTKQPSPLGTRPSDESTAPERKRTPKTPSPPLRPEVTPAWKPLWRAPIKVGWTADLDGQIAVRGPLIVVAARNRPDSKGEQPAGVYLIDGREGRVVRRFVYPGEPTSGVALDGDHFVFASSDGTVRKVRLDGEVAWSNNMRPGHTRSQLSLIDLNGDGTRDVLAVVEPGQDAADLAVALDGIDGSALWHREVTSRPREACVRDLHAFQVPDGTPIIAVRCLPDGPSIQFSGKDGKSVEGASSDRPAVNDLRFDLGDGTGLVAWRLGDNIAIGDPLLSKMRFATTGMFAIPSASGKVEGGPPPSAGDLDGDGAWDVVVGTGSELQAFSTGLKTNASVWLPRGDLQATGAIPGHEESPASYNRSLPPTDARWLRPTSDARDPAFEAVGLSAQDFLSPQLVIPAAFQSSLKGVPPTEIIQAGGLFAGVAAGKAIVCEAGACRTVKINGARSAHLAFDAHDRSLWAIIDNGTVVRLPRDGQAWAPVPRAEGKGVSDPDLGPVTAFAVADQKVAVAGEQKLAIYPIEGAGAGARGDGARMNAPSVASFRADQVLFCGGRWYANNEGALVEPDDAALDRWVIVPNHPGPVRHLGCAADGQLAVTSADGVVYRLDRGSGPIVALWLLAGVMALALLVVALLPIKPGVRPREDDDVRHQFRRDIPLDERRLADAYQRRLVDGLVSFVDNLDTRPPVSIAICGPWGSGKSSIMGLVQKQLCETGRYITVWFNAWRFQAETQISNAFYQTILDEFRRQVGWTVKLRVLARRIRNAQPRDVLALVLPAVLVLGVLGVFSLLLFEALRRTPQHQIASTLPVIAWTAALFIGAWQRVIRPVSKVIDIEPAKLLNQLKSRVSFVRDIKTEFEKVFSALGDTSRLVVFVDDLDRCPPDRVADMLEALNMLSDTRQAQIVMAIDPVAVQRAVEVRFKELLDHMREHGSADEAKDFGARYVEKMVTVSVNVPEVTAEHVQQVNTAPTADQLTADAPPRATARETMLRRLPLVLTLVAVAALLYPIGLALRNPPSLSQMAHNVYDWVEDLARDDEHGEPTLATAGGKAVEAQSRAGAGDAARSAPTAQTPSTKAPSEQPSPSPSGAASKVRPGAASPWSQAPPPEIAQAPSPPPMVHEPALVSPADLRQRRQLWGHLLDGLAVALALGAAAAAASYASRRGQMQRLKPAEGDSGRFKDALASISMSLEPNPRKTIRFTNLARFLFYLVKQSATEAKTPPPADWERSFFTLLGRYWTTKQLTAKPHDDLVITEPDAAASPEGAPPTVSATASAAADADADADAEVWVRSQLRVWLPPGRDRPRRPKEVKANGHGKTAPLPRV